MGRAMKLQAWLELKGWTQQEFADHAQMSRPYITNLLSGKCRPGVAAITKIRKATNGDVRFDDWVTE